MQSTGQISTHALSFTPMQGSQITYAIKGPFLKVAKRPRPCERRTVERRKAKRAQARSSVFLPNSPLGEGPERRTVGDGPAMRGPRQAGPRGPSKPRRPVGVLAADPVHCLLSYLGKSHFPGEP